jgi:hypothetical protein
LEGARILVVAVNMDLQDRILWYVADELVWHMVILTQWRSDLDGLTEVGWINFLESRKDNITWDMEAEFI